MRINYDVAGPIAKNLSALIVDTHELFMRKKKEKGGRIVEAVAVAAASSSVSAALSVRHNMAGQHMSGAAYFGRQVGALEAEHKGDEFGPFFEDILRNFSACIVLCVASLEAYLNETMEDVHFDSELEELIARQPILDRYRYFLKLQNKKSFEKGREPFQSISALIRFRNALVHFEPEWDDEEGRHKQLENVLPKKAESPFFEKHEVFFPRRCVSHGYATWAVRACYEFLEEFSRRAAIDFKLAKREEVLRGL